MVETLIKVVKIFIGSPGGLEDERHTAKRVVEEINQSHSEHWQCQFKLVGWEATIPGYSRAQSLINQDLDKCDYFAGVIWNHWGSNPADSDGKYTSGFHEEYERAVERIETGQMKDIVLFFKDIPDVQLKDLGPSVTKVVEFRDKCIEQRKPLFKTFKDAIEFERQFRIVMEDFGWRESQKSNTASNDSDPIQPVKRNEKKPKVQNSSGGLVEESSAKFITDLLQRPSNSDFPSAYEVARLRLIAAIPSRSGNDELHLGNHDANLLFLKRNDFDFSDQECCALLDSGVAGFNHQNVPLWHWIKRLSSSDGIRQIELLSVCGNSQQKGNAIRILQSAGRSVPTFDHPFDRQKIIGIWLSDESTPQEFEAAVDFLSTNGNAEDLVVLRELLAKLPSHRRNSAAIAIVSILVTLSLADAFEKLIEFNPDRLPHSVGTKLFDKPEAIPTETLQRCLILKSDIGRRCAARILHSRNAMDAVTAESLLTDNDPEVRLTAVENLLQLGRDLSDNTIKKVLQADETKGLLAAALESIPDDRYYDEYRRRCLSKLSYDELQQKVDKSSVFDHLEISTLNRRFTKKNISKIRTYLADAYKNFFESKLGHFISLYGPDATIIADIKHIEEFLRQRLTNDTLDALCTLGDRVDLAIIREALDKDQTYFSQPALHYLGKFGDWQDKDRILSFRRRHSKSRSLLHFRLYEETKEIAAALYSIGKHRLADLLRLDADVVVKQALIAQLRHKDIQNLTDDILVAELNNEDDQVRKILSLKCVQSLSQSRIRKLLDNYLSRDEHYYNSVHWLDLGASMPRDFATTVSTFELMKLGFSL
jgi:hypothetical protein